MISKKHKSYEGYIAHQSEKTNDPERQRKWLGEEWKPKVHGFKQEFLKISHNFQKDARILCLGSRTGQEVQAFIDLGFENVVGIDIVPFEPLTVFGDVHNLQFDDESFDLVYSNIIDHSCDPQKMIREIERVLTQTGVTFLQIQLELHQDEYTEFEIKKPALDVVPLFERSFCKHISPVSPTGKPNFAGMNFEMIFQKDSVLEKLYQRYGTIETVAVPEKYMKIWSEVNLPTQNKKLNNAQIFGEGQREKILSQLSKRAYYLTRVAECFEVTNIAEVGTAEGWQFYSFCEYAKAVGGKVYSCDPRDVRNKVLQQKFEEEEKVGYFTNATSLEMSSTAQDIDLFYVDGLHDKGAVLQDALNLMKSQSGKQVPIWIFDDFDARFGCFDDVWELCYLSKCFKVVNVGLTASGKPTHQAIMVGRVETK